MKAGITDSPKVYVTTTSLSTLKSNRNTTRRILDKIALGRVLLWPCAYLLRSCRHRPMARVRWQLTSAVALRVHLHHLAQIGSTTMTDNMDK